METLSPFWILILAYMAFVLFQAWQRARVRRDLLRNLRIGDEVIAAGGILGRITALRDERVQVEISDGVRVWMVREAITGRRRSETDATISG